MADWRMKGVIVDDDESVDGDGEDEELDELDLGLSLGWRGSKTGSSSQGGSRMRRSPFETRAPSSSLARASPVRPFGEELEEPSIGPLSWEVALNDEAFGETERKNGEKDRAHDSQHKRAKVLEFGEPSQYSAASSGAEASFLPVSGECECQSSLDLSKYQISHYLSLFQNDDGGGKSSISNDDRDADGDISGSRNVEDVEVRMDLSDDLLHQIFSFLDHKDLCRAGATCKQWLSASMHEEFWRCLNFENTRISEENFVTTCQRYPNATELNLSGVLNADVLVMEALTSLRHLETLILGKGQLSDGFFFALADCPALTTLSICDASLGNGLHEVTVYHERLRDLHIVKCRVLRISVRCSQLYTLSLKRTTMANVTLQCPKLHELDFSSCHKLSESAIRQAAIGCPLLALLDMSSCSCVSDDTLREIALTCPNLSVLDASYCPNIAFESVTLPMLVDLKLQSCEGIGSASMHAIANCRMLKALQLDNCGLLTSVSLDLPHLRSISLVHLRKFVELNLRSPVLSYVKVSRCSALHRISIISNALQKLVLQKQESLASLTLQCHNLIDVDLSDCESLTNSICKVFSDGGGCPMLRSLILDNCEVGLESLNLGICPKLSVLEIEAPKMLILELKGCGVLSQASINCPCLKSLDASFCRQFVDDSLSTTVALCPNIECLILSSCLSVGIDGLSSLHWLRQLTLLDLSYTFLTNLQPVVDTCSQLMILKLSACKYLTDSSLEALYKKGALPALIDLDLSYSSIGQTAISALLSCCTNLVHVNLNGCTNLCQLVWGSSNHSSEMLLDACSSNSTTMASKVALRKSDHLLEVLNCTGCPNVKKILIPSTANCLYLSKLNFNLSTSLKEVDLTCISLCTLNLSYCSSVEILRLDCPKLTNLQLLACSMLAEEELESAISHCHMLEILNVHSCSKINAGDFWRLRMVCPSLKRIQSGLVG
ncbi:F-box/LRR-repeat protein 15 isoform X2 [Ananas comosus]|uniref:F-box/LRR-repeat protein 15 isoform X2 n=1 Tax=Ananas comosus TaxID=4615 RepID=A0A6P5GF76_ANACO|nr:F-box/LRR-repeat protein 15 isoform X2 [Ananas comosus]